jgi:hypothetical protein
MIFPPLKHHSQLFSGYVWDNLPLIESLLASRIPTQIVLAEMIKASGYKHGLATFKTALYRARKRDALLKSDPSYRALKTSSEV